MQRTESWPGGFLADAGLQREAIHAVCTLGPRPWGGCGGATVVTYEHQDLPRWP